MISLVKMSLYKIYLFCVTFIYIIIYKNSQEFICIFLGSTVELSMKKTWMKSETSASTYDREECEQFVDYF